MPVAKVYVPAGVLTPEQKQQIVQGIHGVINGVEHRPPGAQTYVLINEFPAGDWGSAGSIIQPQHS